MQPETRVDYGGALLPQEMQRATKAERIVTRPLSPPLWRDLGVAHRVGESEGAAGFVLEAVIASLGMRPAQRG